MRKTPVLNANENSVIIRAIVSMTKSVSGYSTTRGRSSMATHILILTYAPKIPLVKSGECTQTIRLHNPDKPKKVGDKLILHTWEGKPYRSKWDWRLETEISELEQLTFSYPEWVFDEKIHHRLYELARQDGIPVPIHEFPNLKMAFDLTDTLAKLNGMRTVSGKLWDIIRWPKPTIRRVE